MSGALSGSFGTNSGAESERDEDFDDEVTDCGGVAGGVEGIDETAGFGFFAWWFRTCSWSLVLLANFSGQRLQAKASALNFSASSSS